MPLQPLSSYLPGLLPGLPSPARDSEAKSPPIRQQRRAAQWQADVHREAAYFRRFAQTPEEEEAIDAAVDEALAKGPDFTRYRRGSAYMEAPKLSVDRNAVARIKFKLQAIRRGTWKVKDKGKHAGPVKHSVIEVFDALAFFALRYGRVYPSLTGLAQAATRSRQTVVNALKVLELFGFVTVYRRSRKVRTALGFKTVQATNAYTIQEPGGWGALAYAAVMRTSSESKNQPAKESDYSFNRSKRRISAPPNPREDFWGGLRAAWEAS
jgi:hypothetical protein